MASTYSDLKIELIGTGEQTGTWGTTTNNNFSIAIGEAITGSADVAFSSADVTVTLTDTNAAQTARNLRLNLTGTSGGARNLILGSGCQIEKLYLINNGLADAVTVKNTSGTGIAVPAGKTMFVYNNGTNVVDATTHLSSLTTGTLSASGATTFTAGTASTSTTTGTAVITGGLGVSGRINAANFDGIVGANTAAAGTFTSLSDSGNLTFTGTGNRILGDFSNATFANRVAFQTSTANANTSLTVLPNGTSTTSQLNLEGDSASANGAAAQFVNVGGSDVRIASSIRGSGTYLPLTMFTGGSERLRIDTSGNVGIGTTSPSTQLQMNSGAATYSDQLRIRNTNFGNADIGVGSGIMAIATDMANITFYTSSSLGTTGSALPTNERMRIDSSGNVGIGTSSPNFPLNIYSSTAAIAIQNATTGSANTDGSRIQLSGSDLLLVNRESANLALYTADTERMRIDSSGNVMVGKTTTSALTAGVNLGALPNFVANTASPSDGPYIQIANIAASVASGFRYISFRVNAGGTEVGSISTNGSSSTAYNTSSDYRLKENIAPMTGALGVVKQLKPVTYNWKADGSSGQGFIAHELAEVVPDCVTGEKDAVDKDGKPKYQGVDTSFLVATLTAAIQEQQTLIENLTTRLNALEGK